MEKKYATQRLIDSVWTLCYTESAENEIEIISYDRTNPIGYEKERDLKRVELMETGGRIVTHARFNKYYPSESMPRMEGSTTVKVHNPKYIFNYKGD